MRGFSSLVALLPIMLLMGIGVSSSRISADEPVVRAEIQRIHAPLITVASMVDGYVELGQSRGNYAITLDIDTGESTRGWILYIRSDQEVFTPEGTGKPCKDLMWKLDRESREAYRSLESHEVVVVENPMGGNARITLDAMVNIDWQTAPGAYSLGLIFRVIYI